MATQGPTLGSHLAVDEQRAADGAGVPHDITDEWELWSLVIGRTALPRLEQMRESLPSMTSVMLCTADGLNLCAVGVDEDEVDRLAALNSSLFAVASAQAEVVNGYAAQPETTMVNLTTGEHRIVIVSFVQAHLGHLLLSVSADDVQLGQVIVHVRQAATDLQEWLSSA